MTSRDFCYWLQGFFEVSAATELSAEQAELVKRHLNMVFKHEIDPSMGDAAHQADLRRIHDGGESEKPEPKELHVHHHHDRGSERIMC